ncbi:MAG TPA: SusC/RagA family TonB-linked outer membrane protein [Gemmatimonadaceae bacterium]|nr:SusC/RagA family TonB-linked outer membrane protein [Gemmatimonadaceae bacterium]
MGTRIVSLAGLMLLLGAAGAAAQQQRVVTGTVADSLSGETLEGARISVRGTALGTFTGANGRFALRAVPTGPMTLTIRMIGYRAAEVPLSGDANEISVRLARDPLQLEEVVVSGQATAVERRNLANAVAKVSGQEVNEVSSQSVEHALQGKVAGAVIATNSGAPGGGTQVRLRGITSINAQSEPLYVVDGVVVSNVAIPSNQNAVTGAASGSNPSLDQDAQVNRIADISPSDIESVEILKGASASAIYGSRASNGVVIITTKRGQSGAPRFNIMQRFGFYSLSNTLGSRTYDDLAEATSVWGPAAANFFNQGQTFDHEEQLAGRNSLSYETVADVSGGGENTRYFVSGVWKNDEGIISNTGFERQSLRANVDQRFGDRVNVNFSTNVLRTVASRGLTNNDNLSVSFYMVLPFTPNFVDLRRQSNGLYGVNPFVASNPIQTADLMKNDEEVWRYIASSRVQVELLQSTEHSLRLIGSGGADYFSQKNELFFPAELQFEPIDGEPGTALLSKSDNLNYNVGANLVHTYSPASAFFSATTSIGGNYADRDLDIARTVARNIVGGLENIGAGTSIQVRETRQRVKDQSFFAQEEVLLFDERMLVTFGVNADRSSVNADETKWYFYPKASASYRFASLTPFIDEFKLRAAYGESGNQPLYGQRFTPIDVTQNIVGLPALVTEGTIGSESLQPERQREFEFGIDAAFWQSRATLELTAFQKNIVDLLLQRTLAPSSGFVDEIFNGGELRTRGIEIGAAVVPVQTRDLQWLFRTTFFKTKSKIMELPVPTFRAGGFGTALGAYQIEEGKSPTQIVGNDLVDGERVVRAIGDGTPDFNMSFSTDVNFRRLRLFALLDWQKGGDLINLTKFLYDLGQNTADFDTPITVDGVQTTVGANRLAQFNNRTEVYIESGSFAKLREVTLSYELPASMLARFWSGIRTARISLSGRNLATWTNYTGLDPEVSNFGNQNISRNIDVAPFPPSRSYWLGVELGL